MSTHVPGFQAFFFLDNLHRFALSNLAPSSIRVKVVMLVTHSK